MLKSSAISIFEMNPLLWFPMKQLVSWQGKMLQKLAFSYCTAVIKKKRFIQKSRRVFEVPGLNLSVFDRFLIMEWLIGNVHLSANKCLPVSPRVETWASTAEWVCSVQSSAVSLPLFNFGLKKVVLSQEWELACVKHILIFSPKLLATISIYFFLSWMPY